MVSIRLLLSPVCNLWQLLFGVMSVYVGIHNAGALCYLISVIQQLYFMNDFKEIITSANSENEKAQTLIENVRGLFAAMNDQQEVDDIQCEPIFSHLYPNLADGIYTQKDASEFLSDLIRSLGLDAQLKDVLTSQLVNMLDTDNDGSGSQRHLHRPEKFLFTSLTVNCPDDINNLEASLQDFTKIETIPFRWPAQPNDAPAVPLTPVPTRKQTVFQTLPKHLTFHLKRFKFNVTTMKKEKLHHRFEFPEELDMQPYVLPPSTSQEQNSEIGSPSCATPGIFDRATSYRYKLSGVVVHKGKSAYKGHYYSFVRERKLPNTMPSIPVATERASGDIEIPTTTLPVDHTSSDPTTGLTTGAEAEGIHPVAPAASFVAPASDRWFLFDDFDVLPFDPTYLDCECFGGPRVLQRKVRRSRSSTSSNSSRSSSNSSARSGSRISRQSSSLDEEVDNHDAPDGTATVPVNEADTLHSVEKDNVATTESADMPDECTAAASAVLECSDNGDADSTASSYGSEQNRNDSSCSSRSENSDTSDSEDSSSYDSDSSDGTENSDRECSEDSDSDGESSYIPTRGKFKSAFLLFYDRIDE